jgi:hypothetical protein
MPVDHRLSYGITVALIEGEFVIARRLPGSLVVDTASEVAAAHDRLRGDAANWHLLAVTMKVVRSEGHSICLRVKLAVARMYWSHPSIQSVQALKF